MENYDYSELIKDAEFEVKYYEGELKKAEGKLFRSRLALEQLLVRQRANKEVELANAENA
ncbi:MAG: hypothetical protein EBY39_03045 [Flavobacteriia bacterium]|nr:hypothetical protein [Flavobacteriia bacterium]